MIVLGIDPGSTRIGFGLISKEKEIKLIDYGVIEFNRKNGGLDKLVLEVTSKLGELIKKYKPELVGIEKIFFSKNVKTGIEVAQTRGALILELAKYNIPMKEISPSEVKSAITGYGMAEKKAVAKTVEKLLKVEKLKGYDDASDALAIALTAAMSD
ncbi:crossover junction endodeoxyribonuclease RuvC [Candidatus Wolfebacteria bacterium]|nr:crossover junction endodeoxyribonuclease RuvC [Candidatus Wolfebacteria bacterium]